MWTKLLEGLGGQLIQRWALTVLTPAFVFWIGGLVTWVWWYGWGPIVEGINQQSDAVVIAIAIGGLLVVASSAAVAQRFILPMLRLAEGYWPRPLNFLRRALVARKLERIKADRERWRKLDSRGLDELTGEELEEHARLDQELMRVPAVESLMMPTRLGNILRAAESRPKDKYGLNAAICWPRLWLVLPTDSKMELAGARSSLNAWTLAGFWSLAFVAWSVWAWWALPVGLLSAFMAYRGMLVAAEVYADLLESVYDVHRMAIYQALRWPFPDNPEEEWQAGQHISSYLWRGSRHSQPTFTKPT